MREGNARDCREGARGGDALVSKMVPQALWWKRSMTGSAVELGIRPHELPKVQVRRNLYEGRRSRDAEDGHHLEGWISAVMKGR